MDMDMSEWTGFMGGVQRRAADLTPVHEQIGDMLVIETRGNFETSGGIEPWDPLAAATLTKERMAYGTRPLLKTRELVKSVTKDARRDYVDVGSSAVQARRQFFGWNGHPRTPARSPFRFRDAVFDAIGMMYLRFFMGDRLN
jgi:hypothetical protein